MNMKENPKDFWAYIRQKTKAKSGVSDLKDSQGVLIQDNEEKANLLNDFFASVFIKEPPGQLPIFDVRYQGQSVTKLIVSTDDVYKRLMSLKVSKSMGPDNCHPRLIDGWLRMGLLPPIGNFADISYLVEN